MVRIGASGTVAWQSVQRVRQCNTPQCNALFLTRHNSTNMGLINAAINAIKLRELGESFSYRKIANQFSVVASTLLRRHKRVTQSRTSANTSRRLLNPQQESDFVQYNTRLTEQGTPPTRRIIQQSASQVASRPVSIA